VKNGKGTASRLETARSFIECSTSGDLDGAMALLHPAMVFREAEGLPYPGEFVGHEGFMGLLAEVDAAYELKVAGCRLADDGSRIIAQMNLVVTSRKSGRSLSTTVSEFYSFTDGLISEGDIFYKDTRALWELATNG
jgi:ketosteroid isomerase-like protein